MALTLLFRNRPAPVEPPAPQPAQTPWPETGETWTPEGVTVVQRYYNQAQAVVLVYTASLRHHHAVACLGCHYTNVSSSERYYPWLGLKAAAESANSHATACRALPRNIPARPDDDSVREQLRVWVGEHGRREEDVEIWVSSLDLSRLTLQRTDDRIEAALKQLADDQPDILDSRRPARPDPQRRPPTTRLGPPARLARPDEPRSQPLTDDLSADCCPRPARAPQEPVTGTLWSAVSSWRRGTAGLIGWVTPLE
ncbi:hypothetical protein ACH47Z_36140 [Streptomyces sp. NPDC020192]|uniref:hypothetical protein n=1 Tax=Streptomyces sp. NPDC020192 TaxID=3365066 RepID=UPI0037B4C5ED